MYENGYFFPVYDLYFHCLPGGCFGQQASCNPVYHRIWGMGFVRLVLFRSQKKTGGAAQYGTAV